MKIKPYFIFTTLFISILFTLNVEAESDEFFGEFSGEPSFKVKTNANGRPTFVLLEDFNFTDPNKFNWNTPKGWEVDGASIPKLAWSLVGGPMSGKYIHASIIHDRYCDIKSRTTHDTHRNFYYGMKANGVSDSKANIMYWAVRTFGPSWKIVKQATGRKQLAATTSNNITDPNKYRLKTISVSAPNVSDEKIKEFIELAASAKSISQIEALSDSVRNKYGSEKLQKTAPILNSQESEKIRIPKFRIPEL